MTKRGFRRFVVACSTTFIVAASLWVAFVLAIYPRMQAPALPPLQEDEEIPVVAEDTIPATRSAGGRIIERRYSPSDGVNIRTGPGTDFLKDGMGPLTAGEKLYVLEERDGWLLFRVTERDLGWSGWVKKDLTVTEAEWEEKHKARMESRARKKHQAVARQALLDQGLDVQVRVHGPSNKYITFSSPRMGDKFATGFERTTMFHEMLGMGFRKFIYTNGKGYYKTSKYE
jgi:uncharacterized protein YgiM (DUF1202 family)